MATALEVWLCWVKNISVDLPEALQNNTEQLQNNTEPGEGFLHIDLTSPNSRSPPAGFRC